jgi:hypothetical protein
MFDESSKARVGRLVLEYARAMPAGRPFDRAHSLRDNLVIESLCLASLTLRLGDELGVNVMDSRKTIHRSARP